MKRYSNFHTNPIFSEHPVYHGKVDTETANRKNRDADWGIGRFGLASKTKTPWTDIQIDGQNGI